MLLFFKNWDLDHLSSTALWVQLETLDSVIFQSSKRCHLYTWSCNVPREVIFRAILNNPMVKLHSDQHFQWDDFHGTQFSRIPWKLPSQDPMWKNKTSYVFHLAAIEKKSVYLCQWFSAKAIYVLKRKKKEKKSLLPFSGHILIWALFCGQTTLLQTEHSYTVPYQLKELV